FPPFPDAKVKLPDIYREVFETQQSKSFEYYSPVIGSWFDMSVYPSGNEISVYFKNIDERKYTQEKILQKTRQLDTIARFNSLLIKEDDWLQALDQSLELFGEVADADRVYFFEHSVLEATGQNVISMKVEWVSEGTIREIDNPNHQNHSFDDIGSFINRVIEEGGFNGIISEIEEKGLAEFVSGQQIKSILALPVFTGKEFRGFIGFDDCTTERIWTEEEITFLKTIAINLGSAIENEDAEEALQKAFEEKNAILDSIGDGFFAVDKDFTITYWNRQAEIMSHTRRDDIIGKNLWTVFPEGKDISSYELYHKAIEKQEKQHCEDFFAPLDKWFEISAYPSESGLSVFFKDVTERNKARREIQVSNERFIKVSDASKDAIWDFDVQNENLFWGKGFNSLFGYDLDKTKPTLGFLISRIHPGDRERVAQNIENYMSDASKTDWFEEYKFQRENGSYAYVMDRAVFIRNKNKEVTRVVGAMTDLTRQKEFEESLKQLNIELEQRAKQLATSNAELEQFAFVASHDLQEPLRMITGFLAQLEKKYDHLLDDKGKKYIHFATDGARRMRQIILDLLEYSRVGRIDSERERVDLNALVEDTLSLNRKLISERNAKIQVQEMPVIKASKGPMRQLFQNLVNNALKYHKKGSAPVVDISWSEDDDFWHFEVRDNGIGINAQYSQKIFNIFQRLHGKEDYSGSGMGLAICKKIVEEHGGSIGVKSEDGKGSTFYFSIEKNQREIANVE
ncbi:MAG: PAS domain S-box protein, partial [Balneolaceae bacterium]